MTKSLCRVSDTKLTVKACGALVRKNVLLQVHDELTRNDTILHEMGRYMGIYQIKIRIFAEAVPLDLYEHKQRI